MTDSSPEERRAAAVQELFGKHLQDYPLKLQFPATVRPIDASKAIKTSSDLIQFRLIEAGVMFDADGTQTVEDVVQATDRLVLNLQQSGCFNHVQVHLVKDDTEAADMSKIHVALDERNWYKLYIGGGIKNDGALLGESDSLLPKLQFETKGSLINLQGVLDTTAMEYCVDQTSATSLRFSHDQPLYTLFPPDSRIRDSIIEASSEINMKFKAELDTVDHEWTRSYKEFQRTVGLVVSSGPQRPEMAPDGYMGIDWSMSWRDVIPRRNPNFTMRASPEIIQQSGPSVKHSVVLETRTNGALCDDRFQPTQGIDFHAKVEVAGPPGDVGFVKAQGGAAMHYPMTEWLSLHGIVNGGCASPLSFGGLCTQGPTVSDKFFVGGPNQMRGFVPSGIGPRAKLSSCGLGDALGGDLFYTTTLAASTPIPYGARLFGFANAGTLTGMNVPLSAIALSTRASIGAGLSMGFGMGRLEATYAWPIRYGPRDARRALQFGFGLNIG